MDAPHRTEPTLAQELRASALLFGLALGCTVGFAAVAQTTLWLLGR